LRAWVLLGLIWAACMVGVIVPIELPSPFYVWTAPAWLLWYLYATSGEGLAFREGFHRFTGSQNPDPGDPGSRVSRRHRGPGDRFLRNS